MSPDFAIELGMEALWVAVLLAGPVLLVALITGLIIGMFQAATQINEQTLSFVPKLGTMAITLFVISPWMLNVLLDFTRELFRNVPTWVG